MKYPKLWNGPSPVGEAMVRALQQTDAPFLTTIAPDGTIARKMGALSEVMHEGGDGWVSSGDESIYSLPASSFLGLDWAVTGGGDPTVIRYGKREKSGLFIGVKQEDLAAYYSLGYGGAGRVTSFRVDGSLYPGTTDVRKYEVASARAYGARGRVDATIYARSLPEVVPGAFFNGEWVWGVASGWMSGALGQSASQYTFISKGVESAFMIPAKSDGALIPTVEKPAMNRISPNELIGFVPGRRSTSSPFWAIGSQIVYSFDNGLTWYYIFENSTIMTDRFGYDPEHPLRWNSDDQVNNVHNRFFVAPVADGSILFVVGEAAYVPDDYSRLRVYRLSGSTLSLAASGLQMGGSGLHAAAWRNCGHHHGWPFTQVVDEANSVTKLVFIHPAGTSLHVAALPQPSHMTGIAAALDLETIQCPMYLEETSERKAGYYLCFSGDFGATWQTGPVIKQSDAAPPVITFNGTKMNHVLFPYARAFLPRLRNLPARTYPGAPWIGDGRITPPWESA